MQEIKEMQETKQHRFDASDTAIKIMSLHPTEMNLLYALRNNWRYGEVVIIMRDGLPYRLKKVEIFEDLNT